MRFFSFLSVWFAAMAGLAQNPVLEANMMIQGYATSQGVVWCVADQDAGRVNIRLLNADLSERSSFTVSSPSGESASGVCFCYDRFINADDWFEVGVSYSASSYLYNENGVLLKELPGISYLSLLPQWDGGRSASSSVRQEEVKLRGYKMVDSKLIFVLYDLPLFAGNAVASVKTEEVKGAYPSPASRAVVIPLPSGGMPYVLSIFTRNGMLVKQLPVDGGYAEYVLDVSDFDSGIYLYEVAGIRNSFVVE